MLPRLWLWRVRPVSSGLRGKRRRSEGNLPTRSATLFHADPLRMVEGGRRSSVRYRCLEAGLRASWIWGEASEAERWCHGCHVRTSCHVKYCFQRGVERPLIGYLPRTPSRPWLIQHFWNAVVGLLYKEAAAFHKTQTNFNMLRFAFILSERL